VIKLIKSAKQENSPAFHRLFEEHRALLESFIYRLTSDREETKDIMQDVYLKSWENIKNFKGNTLPSFKAWLFSIASNHSKNILYKKNRWDVKAQDVCRDSLISSPEDQKRLVSKVNNSPASQYEVVEHLDFCFTCISKSLSWEQQVALVLKNIYEFKVMEISDIMNISVPKVKHRLHDARSKLDKIYRHRCSLINKAGVCYQCDELNDIFGGHGKTSTLKNKLQDQDETNRLELRTSLLKAINPLNARGTDLHQYLMEHLKKVNDYS